MEKERGFLHQQDSKALLEIILPQILKDLTTYGECTIPVDDANILNLKLFPKLCDPIEVFEYQVPVAIRDLKHLIQNGAEWDLALQKTLPYIDGVNYVKRISLEAEVDVLIVKKCLRQLLYYGCITMMDIFLHSNIYMTTKQIAMLAKDSNLQQECMAYITKKNKKKTNGSSLSFAKIFALYCSLQPSLRMSDFCILYAESLVNIDVRRFITFGLIHSFLRRVHRYPIYMDRMKMMMMMQRSNTNIYQQKNTNTNSKSTSTGSSTTTSTTIMPSSTTNNGTTTTGTSGNGNGNDNGNENGPIVHRTSSSHQVNVSLKMGAFEKDILKMMDGQHHTDEICTTFMVRYADIEQNFMSNSISSTTCSPSNTLYCMVLK
jgi:hypothetical protein